MPIYISPSVRAKPPRTGPTLPLKDRVRMTREGKIRGRTWTTQDYARLFHCTEALVLRTFMESKLLWPCNPFVIRPKRFTVATADFIQLMHKMRRWSVEQLVENFEDVPEYAVRDVITRGGWSMARRQVGLDRMDPRLDKDGRLYVNLTQRLIHDTLSGVSGHGARVG